MKKTLVLSAWLIFFSVTSVFGAQIVISVSDFKVESDELSHKYIGKGLSRLVAVELKKSRQVELLEREQIMKILEEQELSLSDLADDAKQVEIGQLLAAQYIIFGEVINMGTAVLLSLRMVNVATGKIEWQEAITEKLESYDYIGAYFAKSILNQLGAGVEEAIVAKIEKKEVKDVKAIVRISEGIDAYDKGDKEKAKQEFSAAKKIDPVNEVAILYLAKLITSMPKFRVENEYYAPTYNPAYLGLLKEDSFYIWGGNGLTPPDADQWGGQTVEGYYFKEYPGTMAAGYALPLGQRLGMAVEYNGGQFDRHIGTPGAPAFDFQGDIVGELHPYFTSNGASLSLGYLLLDQLSLGTSLRFSYVYPGEGCTSGSIDKEINYGIAGGFVFLGWGERLTFDLQVAFASQQEWYLDVIKAKAIQGSLPLILDSSLVVSFLERRLFTALKGIGDIYLDERGGHALRLIPIVEYWLLPVFSLRAGFEYSHLNQADRFSIGQGFLAGFTFKIRKIEINGNYTFREKPSRLVPGYVIKNSTILFGVSYNPGFIKRE